MFNNNVSIELGWLDMGDTSLRFHSGAADKGPVIKQTKAIFPETGQGGYFSTAYHHQLSQKWTWKNSVGIWFWPDKRSISLDDDVVGHNRRDRAGLVFDSSLRYQLMDKLTLSVGVSVGVFLIPLEGVRPLNLISGFAWRF